MPGSTCVMLFSIKLKTIILVYWMIWIQVINYAKILIMKLQFESPFWESAKNLSVNTSQFQGKYESSSSRFPLSGSPFMYEKNWDGGKKVKCEDSELVLKWICKFYTVSQSCKI